MDEDLYPILLPPSPILNIYIFSKDQNLALQPHALKTYPQDYRAYISV